MSTAAGLMPEFEWASMSQSDPFDLVAGERLFWVRGSSCAAMFTEGQHDGAISAMRQATDLDDASEKNVATENKLIPIRAVLGRSSGW